MISLLPGFTLFPYTTLFRSSGSTFNLGNPPGNTMTDCILSELLITFISANILFIINYLYFGAYSLFYFKLKMEPKRSEEQTSELQSQSNLVCRLLLEKKKKI